MTSSKAQTGTVGAIASFPLQEEQIGIDWPSQSSISSAGEEQLPQRLLAMRRLRCWSARLFLPSFIVFLRSLLPLMNAFTPLLKSNKEVKRF